MVDRIAGVIAKHPQFDPKKVRVLIADTAQRWSAMIGTQQTEAELLKPTLYNGTDWFNRHLPRFVSHGISLDVTALTVADKTFLRWDEFRASFNPAVKAEYLRTHSAYCFMADRDPAFADGIEATQTEFLGRPSRANLQGEVWQKANDCVFKFLMEEGAVYTMLARRYRGFAVYPGPGLAAFDVPRMNLWNYPANLQFSQLPEILQQDAKHDETPLNVLQRNLLGMEQQQFIELHRGNKKKYVPGGAYSIAAAQTAAAGIVLPPADDLLAHLLKRLDQVEDQRPAKPALKHPKQIKNRTPV